ncbi:MAG: integrase [Gallionellales bacterium RIFOXYB12_FULL_54_9]|nr:MAG: integrase [Gallionellales bacterium RIFOXYB12_FULL_54_9]
MNPICHSTSWLLESQLAAYVDALTHHFTDERYAPATIATHIGCIAHFAHWSTQSGIDIHDIDEKVVHQFLNEHLPHCDCAKPVHRVRGNLVAALGHLIVVLRANSVIAEPSIGMTPVDEELRHFDEYMNHVRGLAPRTRSQHLCVIRRLLFDQFADNFIVISAIKPDDVRKFVATQSELCRIPLSITATISALQGYFRYRATRGDPVNHLTGVMCHPANWQLASLPKPLSSDEIERLIGSLQHDGPSARRTAAIVHCALDLGLRSCEVAYLGLDDIDWRAATITLRRTKGCREDVMPLPAATGRAIADYLQFERPKTTNRAVFVRRLAPHDKPIGPDLVQQAIRQAYARAGLPYTRSHLLRHTMASRLLDGGSSLKEVADVLRHRSLNTTMIYAKLDSRNLAAVALPWPGSAS